MEFAIIVIIEIILIIILKIVFGYNIKEIKKLAKNDELDKISKKYPDNIEICKEYLKMLKNENVKIEEDHNAKNCLYIAITNKIVIADINNSYSRIQTIAHECLHSVQSKKILLFNFIFSNIYLIYFLITSILALIGILKYKTLFLSILLLFSMIYILIRNYLETDAMTKAGYLAKEYMEKKQISEKQEIEKLVNKFEEINSIGIKSVNYNIFLNSMWKIIIFCTICIFK